jgi:ABC-type polysaccharide/polyol phosphate export permease
LVCALSLAPNPSRSFVYIAGVKESVWRVALRDVKHGLSSYRVWMFLGWQDIRQRYRRSVLGPIWLTLSTGIMVAMMSLLYGRLFKLPLDIYAPFLASGTIIWGLISTLMSEGCNAFMAAGSLIKQARMPLSLHVFRVVWRNLIIFFHNAAILIFVWLIFDRHISALNLIYLLCALALISINGFWVGLLLGPLCARFRDVGQIVANLIQVVFFVTPIMWQPGILEGRGITWWLITMNPFFHFIEIARKPLLNESVPLTSWMVALSTTIVGLLIGMLMIGKFRKRIPYWL